RDEFLVAADVPRLPPGVRLASGPAMDGLKLPPEDVIDRLLAAGEGLERALTRVGFAWHEHHVRDRDHESWQSFELGLAERRSAARGDEPCWCIPWEEILCVALGDWEALGFESVTRHLYVGSIQGLRLAVERALELAGRWTEHDPDSR